MSYFISPALTRHHLSEIQSKLNAKLLSDLQITGVQSEYRYYIQVNQELSAEEECKLKWVLKPFDGDLSNTTFFPAKDGLTTEVQVKISPRLNFSTPFSTNAVSICSSINLPVSRIERSTRYVFEFSQKCNVNSKSIIISSLHDTMTECHYEKPIVSFEVNFKPDPWGEIDVLGQGKKALEDINNSLGLALDD